MNTLLLVGLGNPGKEYQNTRHNAGSDFVRMLCNDYQVSLAKEKLVNGYYAKFIINDCSIILCIPDTFMNESGISVSKAKKFFKVENHEILIKDSGGHGGHNGLRNIIDHLNGDSSFKRMRIGIGHPGKDKDIVSYVLNKPSESERKNMENKMKSALPLIESLVINGWEKTIMKLHSSEEKKDES